MSAQELCEIVCETVDPETITREAAARLTRIAITCLACDLDITDDDVNFLKGFLPKQIDRG